MTKLTGILATTNVDLHNEQMTVEALQSLVDAVSTSYILLGIEHDPRIPPHGRVLKAWLETQPDGSTAVKGEMELFDDDIGRAPAADEREVRIRSFDTERLVIFFDRNFHGVEDQELLSQLAQRLDAELQEEFRKALDPLSILAIGGPSRSGPSPLGS